uniref:E3 SUMO-protein ligase RanBP2-like n=1 Tax=Saccoglossus kowalevskii TaxID=10224 RepID=A0ABM0MD84_SACKO|nr:PREDICTED: E3 SUMO-protein ligase RanBP2-like [Saccoglossus kowalevskii]
MIRSRQEVDKYVSAAIRNLSSPHEQNLKGYAFARMYYEAQDYDKAIHYITVYLSVNQSDAKGHRLLGKIQQTKKHYEKAIDSYRRSYELNNTQRDLVLQVAELYCHVRTDPQRAQYWVDQATRFFQGHKTIFKLREHLLRINGASVKEIEDFLVTEMASSPDNVDLHIKLVKLYKDNKRLDEAYNRCIQCERNKLFSNNLQWFVLQADLLQAYLKSKEKSNNNKLIQDIYVNLLNVASKVVLLSMEQHDAYAESTDCLARFDQYLLNAYNYCPINNDDEETEWTVALREMRGQLYYLCGVLITKMAFKGAIEWSEALSLTAVCYLASLEISLPNTQTAWMATAMRNNAQEPMRWYYIACNRLSQVAHLVDNLYEHHGGEWLDKTCEKWCSPQGREEIFYKLFSCRYNSAKSFFHQDIKFCQVNGNDALANIDDDLITYDEGVVADQPHSLRHIIWLALQWFSQSSDVQPDVVFLLAPAFEKLHYNVQNLQSVAVETICQLDIQSFVYAVVYCSKHLIREQYIEHHMSDYQQEMLPLCLSKKLVTTEQEEWWNAVCSLYTGKASASERSKLRLKAQKGLEVIRVIGKHGIQTELLVHLAKCFASRMNETRQMSEQQWYFQDQYLCLQSRAALYWEGVLPILERFAQDMNVSKPSNPFFKHVESSLQLSQVREYIREGMKFVASMTFEKGDHEKALELFETIGNADAVFNQAMIYKLLSQRIMEDKEGDIDSDDERKKLDLLKKSRECLYMAVDKLGTRSDDPLNRKIAEALEEVDSILDTLTPVTRRLNFNGSVSSVSESGDVTSPLDRPVLESTVREDQPCVLYDPSPRRIAAELRNLNSSHTKLVENHSKLLEKYSELQNNYGKSQQQIETLSKQLSDVMLCKLNVKLQLPTLNINIVSASARDEGTHKCPQIASTKARYAKQLKDIQTSQRPEPPQAAAASSPKSTMTHEQQILILAHQLQQIGPSSVGSVTVTTATSSALHGYVGGMPGLIPPHVDSAYGSMASQPVTAISTLTDSFHAATTSTESSLPSRPGFVASTTTVESGGIFPRFSFASQGTGDYNFAAPLIQHETVPRPDSYFGSAIQSYNNTTTSVSLSTSNQAYLIGSESSEIPDKPKEAPAPPAQTSIFGTRTGASELTFQDMANSNKTTSFGDGGAFKGAGRKLFEQNKDVTEEESGEEGDTTDDGIHFEPIVQIGCDDDLGKPEKSLSSYMGEPPRLIKKSELSTMKTHSDGKTLVIVTSPGKALGTQIIQQNQESTPGDQPFSDTKKGGLTFEGIASSSQGHGFSFGKTSGSFKGFAGAGSQLFGHSKNEGDEDGYFEDDAGDNIHFEPVAQLPENVDLSTGEEDEEILYKERAKLYRFDHSNGQWKERGVGTLKLLRHCKTGHIRLLMRRDQVHKVCANHRITTSMKLTENAGSDRTWVWNAMDYADEKPKLEQLAVKFKFPTIANEFKNMFEKCQEMLANCAPTTPEKPPSVSPNSKASPLLMSLLTTDSKTEQGKTLTQLFKPPPGSWICKVCEVRNEVSKTACLACCTPKDGAEGSEESSASGTKGFSFGTSTESQGLGSFTFGYQPQKSETDRKTFTGFTFSSTKSDADNKDTPKAFSGFSFGSVKSNTSAPVEFDGGSTSKSAFGLSLTSLTTSVEGSSEKSQLNKSTASQGDDYYNSDEGDHIHFEPIVSMPEKVDLKTGEEDEESIFSHRAKLYRFDAGLSQWKERGVGDIKILQHRETSKARIVMRREQVLKLCANHYITDEMTLKPNAGSDLSWVWNAVDGSEGEPQTEQLAVKFKTANTAKYFHDKFLAAQESQKLAKAEDSQKIASPVKEGCLRTLISPPKFTHVPHVSDNSGDSSATSSEARAAKPSTFATFSFGKQYEKPSSSTSSIFGESKSQEKTAIDPDFVEVVFENKPSSQQVTDAKKYKLPATFYLYEEKPPCIGCRGCSDKLPDDWDSWTDRLNKPLYLDDSRAETPRPESTMKGEKDKYFDSSNSASFGTVASESPDGFLFGKKDPSFKFQGAGSMLFGSSSSRISDAEGDQVGFQCHHIVRNRAILALALQLKCISLRTELNLVFN